MKKRIFIGMFDISGQIEEYKKGYKSIGYDVFTMVNHRNRQYINRKYSFVFDDLYPGELIYTKNIFKIILRKIYTFLIAKPIYYLIFIYAIFHCNIFHFMWITTKQWKYILPIIKILKKKIVVSFVGSDIRWIPSYVQEFDIYGFQHLDIELLITNTIKQKQTINNKLRTLRTSEKYADIILSGPDQSQLSLRPYYNFYIPLSYENIKFNLPENPKPIVIHAVTERIIKGTDYIIKIIEKILNENPGLFEFKLIENKPHSQLLNILSDSDIVIYSPFTKGTGKFGIEVLSAGCVLLTGYDSSYNKFPQNAPIVNITQHNLEETLIYYISNNTKRKKLAEKGRKWVEKYADPTWICNKIINNLNNPDTKPDYYPEFFRHHATFNSKWDSPDFIEICNKWTNFVKNCNWYKKYVKPSEREGLKF